MDTYYAKEKLISNGHKFTKQREIIYQALLESRGDHLNPEEIHQMIVNENEDIGIATVYRTLQLFEELGIVNKHNFDHNCFRYELVDLDEVHSHHHLICSQCQNVQEMRVDLLDDLEERIEREQDFTISNHDLMFYGICSDCKNNKEKK